MRILAAITIALLGASCSSLPEDIQGVSPFVGKRTAIGGEVQVGRHFVGMAITHRTAPEDIPTGSK